MGTASSEYRMSSSTMYLISFEVSSMISSLPYFATEPTIPSPILMVIGFSIFSSDELLGPKAAF